MPFAAADHSTVMNVKNLQIEPPFLARACFHTDVGKYIYLPTSAIQSAFSVKVGPLKPLALAFCGVQIPKNHSVTIDSRIGHIRDRMLDNGMNDIDARLAIFYGE